MAGPAVIAPLTMAIQELGICVTRDLLALQVKARFPAGEWDHVLGALDARNEHGESLSPRVQLAIIRLSEGRAERVTGLVARARIDFRDVLADAEYRNEMAEGVAADHAAIAAARRRDIEEFRMWFEGTESR